MTAWFSGQWVWITGAAGGLGLAIAREFDRRGARLVLTDIDEARLVEVASAAGLSDAVCLQQDVTSPHRWTEIADRLAETGMLPRVLVNNAGIACVGPIARLPDEAWRRVIDVDLWGTIYGCRELVPRMLQADQRCAVLNVASAASWYGGPLGAPYFVAKAGVLRLTQSYQGETDPRRVRFTVFCPGAVTTGIGRASRELTPAIDRSARFDRWQNPTRRTTAHAARRAVRGVVRGTPVVNAFAEAHVLEFITRLFPHRLLAWINRRVFLYYLGGAKAEPPALPSSAGS